MNHDVFLSHNSRDKHAVENLAHRLLDAGIKPWFDKWDLVAGRAWLPDIELALQECPIILACIGPSGFGRVQQPEIEVALNQVFMNTQRSVIPVILPEVDFGINVGESLPPFLKTRTWVDLRLASDFNSLVQAIRGKPSVALSRKLKGRPYRGLSEFREIHAQDFFGRGSDVNDLIQKLREGADKDFRMLTLLGASGSGKSSLVLAGVVPAIRSGQLNSSYNWQVIILKPGARPCHNLSVKLVSLIGGKTESVAELEGQLIAKACTLSDTVDLIASKSNDESRLLIVIDQFEEIFAPSVDNKDRSAFLQNVLYSAKIGDGLTYVIITMRADFLGLALKSAALANDLKASIVLNTPIGPEGLRDAICRPALRYRIKMDQAVVDTLVNRVVDEPGNLPLLQFALDSLWLARRENLIDWHTYLEIGELEGAIAKHAEHVCQKAAKEQKLNTVRTIFRLLINPEGIVDTRQRVSREDVVEISADASDVLNTLITERLVTAYEEEVEIAHEALIRSWKTLQEWVNDDRQFLMWKSRLRRPYADWKQQNHTSNLLSGPKLLEAKYWFSQRREALTQGERNYVQKSISLEKEKTRKKQFVWGTVALVLASFGIYFVWHARTSAAVALERAQRSTDLNLIDSFNQRAEELWPARSGRSLGFQHWLEDVQPLLNRLPKHEKDLNQLRQTRRESKSPDEIQEENLLEDLVTKLKSFASSESGAVSRARSGLAFAQSIKANTLEGYSIQWQKAMDAIATSDRYGKMKIKPQEGLIPLQLNPSTGLYEFLDLQTHEGELPKLGANGTIEITSKTGIIFVLIPAGVSHVGSQSTDPQGLNYFDDPQLSETPRDDVALDSFFIAKYEMTAGQWFRFTHVNPSSTFNENLAQAFLFPVEQVSWTVSFNTLAQMGLQLPTEAQWEYACRAKSSTPFWFGKTDAELMQAAWYIKNSENHVHPIGEKLPNPFGLFDVHGNVWEWCQDEYGFYNKIKARPRDGLRSTPHETNHPIRGGGFLDSAKFSRSASRGFFPADNRVNFVGVRPVRQLEQ